MSTRVCMRAHPAAPLRRWGAGFPKVLGFRVLGLVWIWACVRMSVTLLVIVYIIRWKEAL